MVDLSYKYKFLGVLCGNRIAYFLGIFFVCLITLKINVFTDNIIYDSDLVYFFYTHNLFYRDMDTGYKSI